MVVVEEVEEVRGREGGGGGGVRGGGLDIEVGVFRPRQVL